MANLLESQKEIIRNALNRLYEVDDFLFHRNNEKGVGERAIGFRFALHLQSFYPDYFVDCDFDSSYSYVRNEDGSVTGSENHGKLLTDMNGNVNGLYVDIIVHKRDYGEHNDLICFELKKWNQNRTSGVANDFNKLQQMTSDYGYYFGFHLIFGKTKVETRYTIFQNGKILEKQKLVFDGGNND